MGRWEPNARGRLEEAALELYAERGYDQTTVAEIAQRAGLTERTFYRHFTDKREVLFSGGAALEELLVHAIEEAPEGTSAYAAVEAALDQVVAVLRERADVAPRRQAVIESHAELRERELGKLAAWSTAIATALRERGVEPRLAEIVAQTGVAVFRVAFETWIADTAHQDLGAIVADSFAQLRAAAAD
ncbi:TetR/AcrR family transcriptional regulator [Nocardioides sp. T2.26MG-1]|uniref:TetR/AcrR family transcriptional regulator n=1 Tax=Nocardioides sp. T2.26MG-1 TaxID=3041166 RepID=UPI002477574D|nr:TetR family transcriptional regulator [Nocardioides sp. T2.26MG-1]CAI9419460.1 HTH-type transcriptional regulator BetI [Nocardioides sp. T2.26MG-1]